MRVYQKVTRTIIRRKANGKSKDTKVKRRVRKKK